MISFGVMPESKKNQNCVYCDSTNMYYIYGRNADIYNGQVLSYYYKSKNTKFQKINNGDILTMFIDNKDKEVYWYINSRYAGSQWIKDIEGDVYPFIEMTSRGDEIKLLN